MTFWLILGVLAMSGFGASQGFRSSPFPNYAVLLHHRQYVPQHSRSVPTFENTPASWDVSVVSTMRHLLALEARTGLHRISSDHNFTRTYFQLIVLSINFSVNLRALRSGV